MFWPDIKKCPDMMLFFLQEQMSMEQKIAQSARKSEFDAPAINR